MLFLYRIMYSLHTHTKTTLGCTKDPQVAYKPQQSCLWLRVYHKRHQQICWNSGTELFLNENFLIFILCIFFLGAPFLKLRWVEWHIIQYSFMNPKVLAILAKLYLIWTKLACDNAVQSIGVSSGFNPFMLGGLIIDHTWGWGGGGGIK